MLKVVLFLLAIFASLHSFSQGGVGDLSDEIKKSQKTIQLLDQQLQKNQELQKDREIQRKLLDSKVAVREQMVRQLDANIAQIKLDMGNLSGVVFRHNKRLDSLYNIQNILYRSAYKLLVTNKLSHNISPLVTPLKVEITKVNSMLAKELSDVDSIRKILGSRYDELLKQNRELSSLYKSKSSEIQLLASEKREIEELNTKLKREETVIRQSADSERNKIQNLQRQIANLVQSESKNSSVVLTGKNFADNKGKLPPPLISYTVEDVFGVHPHPTKKGIKIQNNGINIKATMDLSVSVIYEGEVRGIFLVEGMGTSVLVRHGNYFSVYSNLAEVNVTKGQIISTGQSLGRLADKNRVLHFEIWNGTTNLNPQNWIRKR